MSIDGSEVAIFVGPLVPNSHSMLLQIVHIGVSLEEPEELVDDGLGVQLFGCEQGETLFEVKGHLMTEDADGASASAVVAAVAFGEDAVGQIEILFHLENKVVGGEKSGNDVYLCVWGGAMLLTEGTLPPIGWFEGVGHNFEVGEHLLGIGIT